MHHHLTRDERVSLAALLRAGHSQAACARHLGVSPSTISREVAGNPAGYRAVAADKAAHARRRASKQQARKIENGAALARRVEKLLRKGRSPEQIAEEVQQVSDETIYAWISRSRKDLASFLPHRGRRRHRYGRKKTGKQGWTRLARSISERPQVVERRSRIGDWEGDTVVGRDRARLLVHVDRKSRFAVVRLVPNGEADVMHAHTVRALCRLPVRTITYDRGSEFSLWRLVERGLGARVYFAAAHHPWERGTCENTNGLLRRFFPKGSALGELTQRDMDRAARLLNHRPRKCLGWRTPCEVFGECCD